MASLSYRSKIDLGVAAGTIAVGLFFLWQASEISVGMADDVVGPSAVPYFLAFAIIGLGVVIGAFAFIGSRGAEETSADRAVTESVAGDAAKAETDAFGFRDTDVWRVVGVIAIGFVYIALFYAFGYVIATGLALVLMLVVFGNRNPIVVIGTAIAGALVYQYVFMGLMGLHDPPGLLFNLDAALKSLGLAS